MYVYIYKHIYIYMLGYIQYIAREKSILNLVKANQFWSVITIQIGLD